MAKFLLKDVKVMVGTTDLSDHAFNVDTPSEREQVDVSGFSPTGVREWLPGVADQTIEIQFENDFAATKVHAILEPLARLGTPTLVWVAPTSAAVSATNPAFGGQGVLFNYNGLSGALNDRSETTATFKPAPGVGFAWSATTPTLAEEETTAAKAK